MKSITTPTATLVGELVAFLDGETQPVDRAPGSRDAQASEALEYERAARVRDRLTAVRKAIEKQQMVDRAAEDLDCFGLVEDELEAAIQVFYVRRGRVVGRKGFIVDKVEDLTRAQLVSQVLEQHYADAPRRSPAGAGSRPARRRSDVIGGMARRASGGGAT